MLYEQLATETKPWGGKKRRYEDQFKRILAENSTEFSSCEQTARDKEAWRTAICDDTVAFEERMKQHEEDRQWKSKKRLEQPRPPLLLLYSVFAHDFSITD